MVNETEPIRVKQSTCRVVKHYTLQRMPCGRSKLLFYYQFTSSKISSIMIKHILIDYLISVDLKLKCFICNSANPNEKVCDQIDKFNGNGDPPPK